MSVLICLVILYALQDALRGYDGVKGFDIQINLTYFLQEHDYYTKSFNYYQL